MLKLKNSRLTLSDGKYWLDEEEFTGIVFEPFENHFYGAYQCLNGVKVKDYYNEFWEQHKKLTFVDISRLSPTESIYNQIYYDDSRFTGVACEFTNDVCVWEAFCEDGEIKGEICWFTSGKPNSIYWEDDLHMQRFEWSEDENLVLLEIESNTSSIKVRFSECGKLKDIIIIGNYFDDAQEIEHLLRLHLVSSKEFVKDFSADSDLFMMGLGVDDEILSALQSSGGLQNTSEIELHKTSVSDRAVVNLAQLNSLKKLRVIDERDEMLSALSSIKELQPDFHIVFNYKEIPSPLR